MHNKEYDFQAGEILLFDKPLGWTSFDLVNKVRSAIKKHASGKKIKVGHAGTLDPLATGLLILCTGKFTKRIEEFQDLEKEYSGTMVIGATTPSFDLETLVDQTYDISSITEKRLIETAEKFQGKSLQVPPIFSAAKIKGKRAYNYARKNKSVELNPKEIQISRFNIDSIDLPSIRFSITCSKGTYIRAIARDFGLALENGAYLSSLVRTRIGGFKVSEAFSVEDFIRQLYPES